MPRTTIPPVHPGVAPIDPLAPTVHGRYEDEVVVVEAVHTARPPAGLRTVRTQHFDLTPFGGRVHVAHVVPAERVDDDLTGLLQDELFGPGWLRGTDLFERVLTGVVRTSAEDALDSWELFYRHTLARLDAAARGASPGGHGSIDGYAPVHDHVLGQVVQRHRNAAEPFEFVPGDPPVRRRVADLLVRGDVPHPEEGRTGRPGGTQQLPVHPLVDRGLADVADVGDDLLRADHELVGELADRGECPPRF